jgi:dCMP deaminase
MIFSSGIKKVLFLNSYSDYKGIGVDEGTDFLRKFGVEVIKYTPEGMHESSIV